MFNIVLCKQGDYMKKLMFLVLSLICSVFLFSKTYFVSARETELAKGCKSAYLIDFESGEELYSKNERERLPIASVCKVMTLLLCFDAIENDVISYEKSICVSNNAAGMGGSQVFLGENNNYLVKDLIKSIIVCSANDSCVALAEAICGSEDLFVDKMNDKAKSLGCENTQFSNCTGLPKPNQYSCAKDVSIMFTNLIKNEDYFKFSSIWLEDFYHPDNRSTCMTNTNKLLRKYDCCDGGKTGFTNEAGFCLAATAFKNNIRVISVILGGESSDLRFDGTIELFNYAFANYKNKIVVDKKVNFNERVKVCGGNKEFTTIKPSHDVRVLCKGQENPLISKKLTLENVNAPIKVDQIVGKLEIFKDGVLYKTVDVLSAESIERANLFDNFNKIVTNWSM